MKKHAQAGLSIAPTQNLAFKKIFGSKGNEDILAGLIEDFFGFCPKEITIVKPYSISELWTVCEKLGEQADTEEKREEQIRLIETISDIKADLVTSSFTAEMQLRKHAAFDARSIYYPFLDFCERYNLNGNKYKDLRPVYSLNIMGEPCFRHSAAMKSFELFDPHLGIPMDNEYLKIVYLELGKEGVRSERQALWQKFFQKEDLPASAPSYIKKAKNVIDITNLGKEERAMMSAIEKYEADQESIIEAAIETAREKYEADRESLLMRARKESRMEIARNLKVAGVEKALILKTTKISEEEYAAL